MFYRDNSTKDRLCKNADTALESHGRIQKISLGGGGALGDPDNVFFNYQRISQRAVGTSLEKQLDFFGPIASGGGRYQNF